MQPCNKRYNWGGVHDVPLPPSLPEKKRLLDVFDSVEKRKIHSGGIIGIRAKRDGTDS